MAIPWLVRSNPPSTRNRSNIPRPLPLVWAAGLPVIFDPSSFDCPTSSAARQTTWRWFWALYGVFGKPADMRTDGYAPTLDEAKAQFETAWHRWLAWAKLSER